MDKVIEAINNGEWAKALAEMQIAKQVQILAEDVEGLKVIGGAMAFDGSIEELINNFNKGLRK